MSTKILDLPYDIIINILSYINKKASFLLTCKKFAYFLAKINISYREIPSPEINDTRIIIHNRIHATRTFMDDVKIQNTDLIDPLNIIYHYKHYVLIDGTHNSTSRARTKILFDRIVFNNILLFKDNFYMEILYNNVYYYRIYPGTETYHELKCYNRIINISKELNPIHDYDVSKLIVYSIYFNYPTHISFNKYKKCMVETCPYKRVNCINLCKKHWWKYYRTETFHRKKKETKLFINNFIQNY